jgi:hypothetical protein
MSSGKDLGNEGADSNLAFSITTPGHDLSQFLQAPNPTVCWIGWLNSEPYPPGLVEGHQYHLALRVKTDGITGPVNSARPYGLAIKYLAGPQKRSSRITPRGPR